MKLSRVRFTFRRTIVSVSVLAAISWAVMLWPKAAHYRSAAQQHALMEKASVIAVVDGPYTAGRDDLARLSQEWVAHHAALRRKYEDAAARPWNAVAPDPPEPFPLSGPDRRVDLHFAE